jgi:predicted nucleic acid-binding protein
MDKIFIDSDIVLDLVQKREPFFKEAASLFSLVEENKVKGFVSPLIFANLFYILRKIENNKFAIQVLTRLKAILHVLTLDEKTVELALSSGFKDFEDAIQYYSALEANLKYLLTRNKKDYIESGLIVCTAKEYLAIRNANPGTEH